MDYNFLSWHWVEKGYVLRTGTKFDRLTKHLGANQLDISSPIRDFTQQCKEWQNYDENVHSIRVKHVRKYDQTKPCTLNSGSLTSAVMTSRQTSLSLAKPDLRERKRRRLRSLPTIRKLAIMQGRPQLRLISVASPTRAWTYVIINMTDLKRSDIPRTFLFVSIKH